MGSTFLLRAAALAVGLICAAACGGGGDTHTSTSGAGGNGSGGGGSGGGLMPTGFKCSGAKVSYKTDVAPLFGAHCAGVEGCHLPMHDPQGAYTRPRERDRSSARMLTGEASSSSCPATRSTAT